jgi:hypothetical protein
LADIEVECPRRVMKKRTGREDMDGDDIEETVWKKEK